MEALVEQVHESSSASVLDDIDIVYVLRVPTKKIMTISLSIFCFHCA
jgi:IclR family pca regulon transcriptional regulator